MKNQRRLNPGKGLESAAGFTVIELILGLGIFAVMALSVFMTFSNAMRIDRDAKRLSTLSSEAYWTLAALEEDLGQMVGYSYSDVFGSKVRSVFSGGEDSLELLVDGQDRLQWVAYGLRAQETVTVRETRLGSHFQGNVDQVVNERRNAGQLLSLVRRAAPFNGTPPRGNDPVTEEILTKNIGPQGLEFAYAAVEKSAGAARLSWRARWEEPDPPAAVRVRLTMDDKSGAPVLEFTKDILLPAGGQD